MAPDESSCGFCVKLSVIHEVGKGSRSRCPVCKAALVTDNDSGTTYRLVEAPEGYVQTSTRLGEHPGFFARTFPAFAKFFQPRSKSRAMDSNESSTASSTWSRN